MPGPPTDLPDAPDRAALADGASAPSVQPADARLAGAASSEDHAADAARLAAESPTTCLNCGAVLPGLYCPNCGQRDQPLRQPAHTFISESVSEYFGVDGRLWRSLGLLLFRPGALTVAYLDGRRMRYLRPLRLYLTATVLFFFLLSLVDPFEPTVGMVTALPVALDSPQTASALDDRLHERIDLLEAREAAVLTASAALGDLSAGDSLAVLADSLATAADSLDAFHDRLEEMPDDTLLVPASLPAPVVAALADTASIETAGDVPQIMGGGFLEDLPDWTKGGLARRYESTKSPGERRLLNEQVQRAMIAQIPTALFLVLPVFALLLKGFYLFGAGRSPRHRPRPPAAGDQPWPRRAWAALSLGAWRAGRWRHQWARRRRLRRLRASQTRTVRGAPVRLRRWVAEHPRLRRWRVRRLRAIRRALRAERNPYYAEHLVFALHVHAFTFLVLIPLLFFGGSEGNPLIGTLLLALLVSIPIYFIVAQKQVYGQGWAVTMAKASALGFAYLLVLALGTVAAAGLALRLG